MRKERRRQKDSATAFMQWLVSMPTDIDTDKKHSAPITITLSVANWLLLREAAFWNGVTMGEIASEALEQSDDVMTLVNGH